MSIVIGEIATDAGVFGAVASERGLAQLTFPGESLDQCRQRVKRWWPDAALAADDGRLQPVAAQLQAYFRGELRQFALPLDLQGTPFQRQVWQALQRIPFGETRSYADIARLIGRPQAVRAVGGANGQNPVPIVVPCHRVIGKNGALVGFAGGLALKQRLLQLEGWAGQDATPAVNRR